MLGDIMSLYLWIYHQKGDMIFSAFLQLCYCKDRYFYSLCPLSVYCINTLSTYNKCRLLPYYDRLFLCLLCPLLVNCIQFSGTKTKSKMFLHIDILRFLSEKEKKVKNVYIFRRILNEK